MTSFEQELRKNIEGEVHFDDVTRQVYSVDASIFEICPQGVVLPKTESDLKKILEISHRFQIPITVRGAATGITGGCLGRGLIVDLSKSFQHILSVELHEQNVVCEPGVIQDALNSRLAKNGYRLGPDTSTGNRATLGGMLANNAAGARSLRYGKMVDHVQEVELLLYNGEKLSFASVTEQQWMEKCQLNNREGEIYRTLRDIKKEYREDILQHFPPIPRRVSGYNLDELLKPFPFNISRLIAGSEGTLGIATKIRMGIVPVPKATGLLLIFFEDMLEAMRHVPKLLTFDPLSFEMIDDQIIELGRISPSMRNRLDWLIGNPRAIFIIEMDGNSSDEVKEKIQAVSDFVRLERIGYAHFPLYQPHEMAQIWDLRKSGLGILLSKRTYSRAIAFLEDISVPPQHLSSFMKCFCNYLDEHGKKAGIYGHVGSGCMHIRPYIDLRNPEEIQLMRQMMLDITGLILEFKGSLSGEHGDGWIRSWLNPALFGNRVMEAFEKLKKAFDPLNLMNPGKIIPTTTAWEDLRTEPNETLESPKTFLDFQQEGGFALAVDLCNGNGLCRKKEGLMCPSFQVTNEEFHSTRARAQTLRSIIHHRLPFESFTSHDVYDVMDLCISCKGCKTECPSQVDMAKLKSEFLYHYQNRHGIPLRNRLFGNIGSLYSWMSYLPHFFNWMNRADWVKKMFEWIGITSKRSLPFITSQRFSNWFAGYTQASNLKNQVVLMNDTFTEFNQPEVGKSAVKLLNALGFSVILADWHCCGRPALSKGLLTTAQKQAQLLFTHLSTYLDMEIPIIGLEPSCLFTLKDDYLALLKLEGKEQEKLKKFVFQCWSLDEFLAHLIDSRQFDPLLFKNRYKKIKVHGHCYQKALVGMKPTMKVLNNIPGFDVEEIPSGCCGMAGSFGYEKEHEAISMQIGNLVLFPDVRTADTEDWIVASGTSCRHQIVDGTGRRALHLAEALYQSLNSNEFLNKSSLQ